MIDFIEKPNLPKCKVTTLICGTNDEKIIDFFKKSGICVLKSDLNNEIDLSVSSHVDMSAFHLGGNKIIIDKKQLSLKSSLFEIGMKVYETEYNISGNYPDDIRLNYTCISDMVIGNFKYIDSNLLSLLSDKKHIMVNQGYCKCSVLVVNENAIITDDESIAGKASENSIDCLLIGKGDITLEGHEYGFIGGASGKISKDTVVFFGNIKLHRDFRDIEAFLTKYKFSYICTDDGKLRDIGGIIPLLEKRF